MSRLQKRKEHFFGFGGRSYVFLGKEVLAQCRIVAGAVRLHPLLPESLRLGIGV